MTHHWPHSRHLNGLGETVETYNLDNRRQVTTVHLGEGRFSVSLWQLPADGSAPVPSIVDVNGDLAETFYEDGTNLDKLLDHIATLPEPHAQPLPVVVDGPEHLSRLIGQTVIQS